MRMNGLQPCRPPHVSRRCLGFPVWAAGQAHHVCDSHVAPTGMCRALGTQTSVGSWRMGVNGGPGERCEVLPGSLGLGANSSPLRRMIPSRGAVPYGGGHRLYPCAHVRTPRPPSTRLSPLLRHPAQAWSPSRGSGGQCPTAPLLTKQLNSRAACGHGERPPTHISAGFCQCPLACALGQGGG